LHHKIKEINQLFRCNDGDDNTGSSSTAINNNIPVIPQMNFAQVNGTNSTTATVTIPICDGITGGLS
jgi:hypothetical protein